MSCEQKPSTKYQGCLEFHDLFEQRCYVCTAVRRAGQIFEIIEVEAPLLNTFALKLSAVVMMVLTYNNVILLIGVSIFMF